MEFDHRNVFTAPALDEPAGVPEWQFLRARLGAQWAARRALTGDSPTCGSFYHAAALALAAQPHGIRSVNPTALGYGKPNAAIDADIAEAPLSAVEGDDD
jgi:hypothetical protein